MAATFKVSTESIGGREASEFVGNRGEVFYDPGKADLRVSDGFSPGGNSLGIKQNNDLIDPAKTTLDAAVAAWRTFIAAERAAYADNTSVTEQGWPWLAWAVNEANAAAFKAILVAGWTKQNAPASPALSADQLDFKPAISQAYYNEISAGLTAIVNAYNAYRTAADSKAIEGAVLKVPEVLETTLEEDLTINIKYSVPSSPSGTYTTVTKSFVFKTNGTLVLPDGGYAISSALISQIATDSADFTAFKAALAAL